MRGKSIKEKWERHRDNISLICVCDWGSSRKKVGTEKICKGIIAKNFPKLKAFFNSKKPKQNKDKEITI